MAAEGRENVLRARACSGLPFNQQQEKTLIALAAFPAPGLRTWVTIAEMKGFTHSAKGRKRDRLRVLLRDWGARTDRAAWRRFFVGLFGLTTSLLLAIYSTALMETGRVVPSVCAAVASLLLAGIIAAKIVPYLARRTVLERWFIRFQFEFAREGIVFLLVVAAIAIAALNTGNNLLFIILASLLAAILVSGVLSQIVLSELELDFVLPDHIFAGRPMISRLTVSNLKHFFSSFSVLISARNGNQKKRANCGDSPSQRILDAPVYIPYIPRQSAVTQHVEITFPRRGRYSQEGFSISSKFPFGLLRKSHEIPTRKDILVLPDVQPTEEFYEVLPLIGGEMENFYRGRGHDLYALRDYYEGDSARNVDWKATAKTQSVKVREFTREDERRLLLVFDTALAAVGVDMLQKFEKAVSFCACLAWHFFEIGAQMQFVANGFETAMAPAQEVIYPVLENLAVIEPSAGTFTHSLLSMIASSSKAFNIIITAQPRGSIPTSLWSSSYLVFMDSL